MTRLDDEGVILTMRLGSRRAHTWPPPENEWSKSVASLKAPG